MIKESKLQKYIDDYSELLYDLLPRIYRIRDAELAEQIETEQLKNFLKIFGDQLAQMRANIDELRNDLFIDTCNDWVIPYIGDLVGTNVIFNDAQRNRVDVRKTVFWRKRKGTLPGLEDLALEITGWGVRSVEFFERLVWWQWMNHIKTDKAYALDLQNILAAGSVDRAGDIAQHTVDVRLPCIKRGRYNIKNLGFFLWTLKTYPISKSEPTVDSTSTQRFYFNNTQLNIPLFELNDESRIRGLEFWANPYDYFGQSTGMSIYLNGVLAAASQSGNADQTESQAPLNNFFDLDPDPEKGMQVMNRDAFNRPQRGFTITAFAMTDANDPALRQELGHLDTTDFVFSDSGSSSSAITLAIRLNVTSGMIPGVFPGTVLCVRNTESNTYAARDSITSAYLNATYIYLPEIFLGRNQELYLYVAEDGSTYYSRSENEGRLGNPTINPGDTFLPENMAHAAEGQLYPKRQLTNSLAPLSDFFDLHEEEGMNLVNEAQFTGLDFRITAVALDYVSGFTQNPTSTEIGHIDTQGTDAYKFIFDERPESGYLCLQIDSSAAATFPMSEIILRNRQGAACIIYLPEVSFPAPGAGVSSIRFDVFPADDGATYLGRETPSDSPLPAFVPNKDPNRGAFNISRPARKSAGQIVPLSGMVPLWHRQAVYRNLENWWTKPEYGKLAVDPELGRFEFPQNDAVESGSLTVDYNYAFSYDVGAGTYSRLSSLELEPTVRVSKSGRITSPGADAVTSIADAIGRVSAGSKANGIIQIEDSFTYEEAIEINKPIGQLVIQAANGQRPTIKPPSGNPVNVSSSGTQPDDSSSFVLNGLFLTGGVINIESPPAKITIQSCTVDPGSQGQSFPGLSIKEGAHKTNVYIYSSILGEITYAQSVSEIYIYDSIIDNPEADDPERIAIGLDPASTEETETKLDAERSTILGGVSTYILYYSEVLHVGSIEVVDQQQGCIRYSRYESGNRLPRVYKSTQEIPVFTTLRFGKPAYAQLVWDCNFCIRFGAENGGEIGAFHEAQNPLRHRNMNTKLDEYMPFGLKAASILDS